MTYHNDKLNWDLYEERDSVWNRQGCPTSLLMCNSSYTLSMTQESYCRCIFKDFEALSVSPNADNYFKPLKSELGKDLISCATMSADKEYIQNLVYFCCAHVLHNTQLIF